MIPAATTDEVFDALADEHRRQLLVELLEDGRYCAPKLTGGSEEIGEAHDSLLLDHLHSSREIAGVDERRLRIHYIHLPKLEKYGFIEWQCDTRTVTPGHRFDQLRPYLEVLVDTRRDRGPRVAPELLSR
ncbi:hypothetical protein [Halovivax sp.]|uniref:hypothetical protein n=1 Tax=Halovivax sp. TaxID=1935978 RepID=UPI0025B7D6DB|nr:hypothetical protein [Halovivax sp.]